jgi:gliding motility-associated-like protein/uncharacterized repeat protein (TIGR01451 family)
MFVHGDSISIFKNTYNYGNLGSKSGSVVNFLGSYWHNDSLATFPDENSYVNNSNIPSTFTGKGGQFCFEMPGQNQQQAQLISGGYLYGQSKGPSFPNIKISNPSGVFLAGETSTRIRNLLYLDTGKVWLNGHELIVGNAADPGTISGYNQNKYIVTGGGVTGNFLHRSNIDITHPAVIFPIGASSYYYTPVALTYKGTAQEFKIRPFNQLFSNAVSGTQSDNSFVGVTWNVGKENNENAETELFVQHPLELEGANFTLARNSSYITRYDFIRNVWDTVPPSGVISPGTLTNSILQTNSFENSRYFISPLNTNEYISKTVAQPINVTAKMSIVKLADAVIPLANGTYNINYRIIVTNKGQGNIDNISVTDNLNKAFPSPMSFSVLSVLSTGTLIINSKFSGLANTGDTSLLLPSSHLNYQNSETIYLSINVNPNNLNGQFYNSAYGKGKSTLNGNALQQESSSVPVTINYLKLHVPGGFSPNKDGVNDKFVITNSLEYKLTVQMFNIYGNKVYDSKGFYNNDWDGTCNQNGTFYNNVLPNGTYYYIIDATYKQTDVTTKLIGFITLKR